MIFVVFYLFSSWLIHHRQVPYFPEQEYPDWHVVDAGNGAFYFFNAETNETSWYPPHLTDAAIEQARTTRPQDVTQRLIDERLEYTQRLQHQLTSGIPSQ